MSPQPRRSERRYVAALTSYDTRRDPIDHVVDRALPEELGTVHCVALPGYKRAPQPQFLDAWQAEDALCGRRVKVLLPLPFKPTDTDEDQCGACRTLVRSGATYPRVRRQEEQDTTDATGVPPSSGHVWTGRTWTFDARDEPTP